MQLRTILNRVYKLPGFVYGKIRLVEREGGAGLGVEVDQGGRAASALEIGGHMDGQGGLAGAALLG